MEPRIIVAEPVYEPLGGPALAAAVLPFPDRERAAAITLIVKQALSFAGDSGLVVVEPPPPSGAKRSALAGATAEELSYPSDLVPEREGTHVCLTGHAYAGSPRARLDASITVGDMTRSFSVVAGGPAARLPLSDAYLRASDGVSPAPPVGPVMRRDAETAKYDAGLFACASAPQRMEALAPDAKIELWGLSPRAERREMRLPGLVARAIAESLSGEETPVELSCDTVVIDTDEERVVLVWRGAIPLVSPSEAWSIPRVTVWLEPSDAPLTASALRRSLQRGRFAYALEAEEALEGRAAPPIPAEELAAARYGLWDESPEARISLEKYAWISAELQEKREPREATLKRHGLDEGAFALEERAWMEQLAAAAMGGDAAPAKAFGDAFLEAQEALAAPGEGQDDVEVYVRVQAALGRGADPSKAIAKVPLTLPAWMRLDRRMAKRLSEDAALRAAIEERIAALEVDPDLLDDEAALGLAVEDDEDDA